MDVGLALDHWFVLYFASTAGWLAWLRVVQHRLLVISQRGRLDWNTSARKTIRESI